MQFDSKICTGTYDWTTNYSPLLNTLVSWWSTTALSCLSGESFIPRTPSRPTVLSCMGQLQFMFCSPEDLLQAGAPFQPEPAGSGEPIHVLWRQAPRDSSCSPRLWGCKPSMGWQTQLFVSWMTRGTTLIATCPSCRWKTTWAGRENV